MKGLDYLKSKVRTSSAQWNTPSRVSLLLCGIIFIGIWSNLLGYAAPLLSSNHFSMTIFASAGFSCGRLVVAILFITLALPIRRNMDNIGLLTGIGLSPIALIMGLAVRQEIVLCAPEVILAVSAFVSGVGFLIISTPLFMRIAYLLDLRSAALCAMAGIVAECIISSLINSYGSLGMQLLVCTIAPLCSGFCLILSGFQEKQDVAQGAVTDKGEFTPRRDQSTKTGVVCNLSNPIFLILQLSCIEFVVASLRSLSIMGPWGLLRAGYLGTQSLSVIFLLFVCLIILILSIVIFVLPIHVPYKLRYVLALVVMLGGLQVSAPYLDDAQNANSLIAAIVMGCQLFGRVTIWVLFMACVRQSSIPSLRVFGITNLFNVAGSLLFLIANNMGANLTYIAFGITYIVLSADVIASAYLFFGFSVRQIPSSPMEKSISAFSVPFRGEKISWVGLANGVLGGKASDSSHLQRDVHNRGLSIAPDIIHSFALSHSVSPREEEVLAFLLNGYTRGQIEDFLGLSEGTVRTHVNAIYHKLDVHSKKELQKTVALWANINTLTTG